MKKHAKKAKQHKVSLFGKTAPTLALIALFTIGATASGALLTNFGTVTGDAEVEEQAITFEGGDTTADYHFTGYAGETSVDSYTLESNTESEASVEFLTKLDSEEFDEESTTSYAHQWATGSHGDFETNLVNYFDEADHHSYEQPLTSSEADYTVSSLTDLEEFVEETGDFNDIGDGESVMIEAGEYDLDSSDFKAENDGRVTIDQADNLHVYSEVDGEDRATFEAERIDGTAVIDVESEGVTVEGFEIDYTNNEGSSWAQGIAVTGSDVEVAYNNVSFENGDKEQTVGIAVIDDDGNTNGVTVRSNNVEGAYSGIMATTFYGNNIDNLDVDSNTVNSENAAVVKAHHEDSFPTNIDFSENNLEGHYGDLVIPDGEDFAGSPTDSLKSDEVTAEDNYFANGLSESEALDSVSYQALDDTLTLGPQESDTVGIVHNFPINLKPDTYSFTTDVKPVAQ